MRKLLFLFLMLAIGGYVHSQDASIKIDERLYEQYKPSQLKKIQKENPDEIEYLNYSLDHAYYIVPFPKGKEGVSEIAGEVAISDEENISLSSLGISIIEDNYQYFKIKGTDKLLVVKSKDHILQELKKNK